MGRDNKARVIVVGEVRSRPDIRKLLRPLAHDEDALELVARTVELLAVRSLKS